jgi:hypothetical protein
MREEEEQEKKKLSKEPTEWERGLLEQSTHLIKSLATSRKDLREAHLLIKRNSLQIVV